MKKLADRAGSDARKIPGTISGGRFIAEMLAGMPAYRCSTTLALVVLAMLCVCGTSQGQQFPTKPIEIIAPFTPGSPLDVVARIVADIAPKYMGQPVVVTNKPGAGGSLGAAELLNSKPDGYKLFVTTNFFFAMTTKSQKIPFDPANIVPLANMVQFVDGLCVRGDSPWKTFADLADYGKKNPGKIRWAHSGRGMVAHVAVLLVFRRAGVETIDIPYKGPPEKVTALLGGHIEASNMTYGTVVDHVRSGKIKFLFFFSDRRITRYPDLANVPTIAEIGYSDLNQLTPFVGLYVHRDTPPQIRKTLTDALKKTYDDPEFKKAVEKTGDEPRYGGPEFIAESIKKGAEIGVPMLKELGLYVGK
ncbi:MAG TPA: tripartite tricarboxylate transporter substrate binding protein [Syntrophorhabdales bacterium]|nr:tripartite tricarboxylate transporter substrate binding protein [Syntrophorhabdales bacterium]